MEGNKKIAPYPYVVVPHTIVPYTIVPHTNVGIPMPSSTIRENYVSTTGLSEVPVVREELTSYTKIQDRYYQK